MDKKWILWLDDVRDPSHRTHKRKWEDREFDAPWWCLSFKQAAAMIKLHGLPVFMFLDHDLGSGDTGMDFLRFLERTGYVENCAPPDYEIISDNPNGTKNMESFMESWKKIK